MRADVRPGAAAARARTRAGSSTPNCSCSPSAAACASPRCRSTGSTTPTAGSTSSPTAMADLRGIARLGRALLRGDLPLRDVRAAAGPRGRSAGRRRAADVRPPGAAVRARSACSTRWRTRCCSCSRRPLGAQGANLIALLLTAVAQHRGQPPVHLRRARRGHGGTSCRGWSCSRSASASPVERWGCWAAVQPPGPRGRADGPGRRQSAGHRSALRPPSGVGLRPQDCHSWFRSVTMTSVDDRPLPRVGGEPSPGPTSPSRPPPDRRTRTAAHRARRRTRARLLGALLAATALLYLWGLGASGYANDFYAAAVQAGTKSWKAISSARSTRATSSPSTSPGVPLADGDLDAGSSGSTPGPCWCRRRSRASDGLAALRHGQSLVRPLGRDDRAM